MQEYVLGFLFDAHANTVALIEKNRPAMMAGFWNGIGGKVGFEPSEAGESNFTAMQREFQAEAGVYLPDWKQFATLSGDWGRCHIFSAFSDLVYQVKTMEDEKVTVHGLDMLPKTLPNVRWMIPMALSFRAAKPGDRIESAEMFQIEEQA
jgi:8-oxo-dGTP pyrophosphatase MutT (NUDIX family)